MELSFHGKTERRKIPVNIQLQDTDRIVEELEGLSCQLLRLRETSQVSPVEILQITVEHCEFLGIQDPEEVVRRFRLFYGAVMELAGYGDK